MAIKKEILDELLKDRDPKTMFSSDGLLGELKKAFAERVLNAEMDHHLADSTQDEVSEGEKAGNHRNGYSKKTVLTENEALELSIPRDRRGTFEPQLIAKYQRRFPGFDEKIVSMYARGMSTREIQGHLRELYGIEASPQLISTVTDAVLEEVGRWQSRPLDPLYALVFFDALRVKMRDEGTVRNKAVYLAIGVTPGGPQRCFRHLDRADRGGEVLAAGDDGDQKSRRERYFDRDHRWIEGISGGHQLSISRDADPDLHRAFDPQFARFLLLERPQTGRQGAQDHLPRRRCPGRARGAAGFRGWPLGLSDSPRLRRFGAGIGPTSFPSLLTPGGAENDLHHECH